MLVVESQEERRGAGTLSLTPLSMPARTSIVLHKDTVHIALREHVKTSKDKMGRGQNVLIVANICRMKLNGGYASIRT